MTENIEIKAGQWYCFENQDVLFYIENVTAQAVEYSEIFENRLYKVTTTFKGTFEKWLYGFNASLMEVSEDSDLKRYIGYHCYHIPIMYQGLFDKEPYSICKDCGVKL